MAKAKIFDDVILVFQYLSETFSFLRRIFNSKKFQFSLALLFTIFFLFQIGYVDAVTGSFDVVQGFEQNTKVNEYLTAKEGQKNTAPDAFKTSSNYILSTATQILIAVAPQASVNYDKIVMDPDISDSSKLGLLGGVNLGVNYALINQPEYDVTQHLASNWVPGYDRNMYSSYAITTNYCDGIEDEKLKKECLSRCTKGDIQTQIACIKGLGVNVMDIAEYSVGDVSQALRIKVSGGYDYISKMGMSILWSKTLMISYALFIVTLIVAGFMIMFRNKIGGQVAVTIYNTIPNILIALLLATFSFAIVGLIMEMSVFLSGVFLGFLGRKDEYLYLKGLIDLAPDGVLTEKAAGDNYLKLLGLEDVVFWVNILGVALGKASMGRILVLTPLVLITVFISIRVFFTLVKAFLGILVDTIAGPLILTFSAIPGLDKLRKQWFMRLIKNALIFPLILLFINFPWYVNDMLLEGKLIFDMQILSAGRFSEGIASSANFIGSAVAVILPFICYNAAANIPSLLEDYFPTQVGQGTAKFIAGAQAPLSKIPFIGKGFKQEGK